MNLKLELKGTKDIRKIYIRIYDGKLDISKPTGFVVSVLNWDKSKKKPKSDIGLEIKLSELKSFVLMAFNSSYGQGNIINRLWLETVLKSFCLRPDKEVSLLNLNQNIYLSDYATNWLEIKSGKYRIKGKPMTNIAKVHYKSAIKKLVLFEGKDKALIKSVSSDYFQRFADWLVANNYAQSSATKILERIMFFVNRAKGEGLEVGDMSSDIYIDAMEKDYKEPFLSSHEIDLLYHWDFSYSPRLDNARDNFIIGLVTGLRCSDFIVNLDIDQIDGEYLRIKTQKTKTKVVIPVHKYLRKILQKRDWNLPPKTNEKTFNLEIKELAFICEFDKIIKGALVTKTPNGTRKVFGQYPKWKLLSSHCCRRSFTTNAFGKVPNSTLQHLGGWTSEKMMMKYLQKSDEAYADELKIAWDKVYK